MYNKRLLLLGITVIGSGWMYPTKVNYSSQNQCLTDTERIAANNSLPHVDNSSTATTLSQELFMAAYVGSSNGVRLNPKALNFIQDYLQDNWEDLQNVRATGRPYFNLIESVLVQYNLPKQLKYLAVIESNLKPTAVSRVGAKGPWQLMPQTARELGLKVNHNIDERKNYYKSTRAAAAYLRDLYNELGDWLLVIAAYNTGTVNVYRAIHRSGSRNFWDLEKYLPAESRSHVKKFIGTQYMFEGQGSVTTLTREEATQQLSGSAMYVFHRDLTAQELTRARTEQVSGKYQSAVIAKYTLMDMPTFQRYNPNFDKVMASTNNSYDLKLPADKMDLFLASKYDILRESAQLIGDGDSTEGTRLAVNK
ncbi:lytic transglycosylase domain-containing protein [Puia sp.]|jgi:membrane-bound lytic murein transglycosylase D|uniref:lytic transglycosylase domain-containing protein n=1 Tax=Puia sp. TaxID=2045100 RepID=UPI002F3FD238